ncbi:MAG: ATPase, partial [Roseburia sp.]|nr:ATPase [Roseburia sp.]
MVEKMKLLHITGPKEDLDRVMDVYLSKYDIHFENAIASLSNLSNVRPFAGTNVYREVYAKAKGLWEYLKDEPISDVPKMKPKEAQGLVEAAYRLTEEIQERQEELRQER